MRTNTPTRKGRILKIELVTRCDYDADTSSIGKYTDTASESSIVCATGEFYADVNRRREILSRMEDRASEVYENDEEYGKRLYERFFKFSRMWEDLNRVPERCGEYRFFVPYAGGEPVGSKNWRQNAKQDFARMQSLFAGDWCHLGIMAQAEVTLPGSDVVQRLTSGGLWGVESDSDATYVAEVEQEELRTLADELASAGFGQRAIALAMKAVERVDK